MFGPLPPPRRTSPVCPPRLVVTLETGPVRLPNHGGHCPFANRYRDGFWRALVAPVRCACACHLPPERR